MKIWLSRSVMLLMLLCTLGLSAQTLAITPHISKIDPPNWWATLPAPMLLVHGEGFQDTTFSLSDSALHITKTVVSANGHWAQLWLAASPAQPETVTLLATHGAEKISQPYTFAARHDPAHSFAGFSSRDVMYLIMTDRFADGDPSNDGPNATDSANSLAAAAERAKPRGWHGGDLRGIAAHLDYLQQLGVTAVWPTPVYRNHDESDSYHGYGATDMYAVDEHYGSLDDLKSLAAALHARGMKLVLDTVPNHVGAKHPWVNDEPTPNWFHGTKAHHINAESNFNALIDPHAAESARTGTLNGWFADVLPDMDTDDPTVAMYLRQNAIWWIEQTGADALRIDTFPYVNREFWHEFNGELKQLYPRLTEVGEAFNADPIITSSFAGGVTRAGVDTYLTTPFDFPTYFAFRDVFAKSGPMTKLAATLGNDSLYPHPESLVTFFGNHDTKRFLSDGAATPAALHLAFGLLATMRGMPQIYSGDEIAMTGGDDPDNRHDFPGGFVGQSENAFQPAGRSEIQASMLLWVQTLMQLRAKTPALQTGQQQTIFADKTTFAFVRATDTASNCLTAPAADRYLVVANDSASAADITLPLEQTTLAGCTRFTSVLKEPITAQTDSGKLVVHFSGQAFAILRAQ